MDGLPTWLQLLFVFGSPIAVYVAIRVDLAVLKVKTEHNEQRVNATHELAADAHDRINRLRSLRERDTI